MADQQPITPQYALRRLAAWGARLRRGRSLSMGTAGQRIDRNAAAELLAALGAAEENARRLDASAALIRETILSLSQVTADVALDYIDRLARPIPSLSPQAAVEIVSRAYAAHLAVEEDPGGYGAVDIPVLGSLPPPRKGHPPQDLLTRVVKASRRSFPAIRAVDEPVWEGFVVLLTMRVHEAQTNDSELLADEVVDGLARFGWVLRQVDIHYKLEPERREA
ncbi:MAG TPA: hypothetical protein VMO88_16220 [Acidimicrobiales bacterium]|nr:hypothetical protein [Acidimicrobiales bacterium]